jgi:hypothetical protein
MAFGKGQRQPDRKRNAPISQRRQGTKKTRKQGREHWQSEQERLGQPSREEQEDRDYDEDYDNDNDDDDDDNEDYDDESEDSDEEFDDGYDEEDGKALRKMQLGMEEKQSLGMDFVKEEEVRVAIKVAYVLEFDSPDESEWKPVVTLLRKRWGVSRRLIQKVFKGCRAGSANPEKRQKGGGRKPKLEKDNAGLIAGVAALNGSASPKMATEICNAVNPPELKVCRNTFMRTIEAYTDCESVAILRRKTGSKDPESDWAKARVVIANQMLAQVKLGKEIDDNLVSLSAAFEDVEKNNAPPPIFPDGVLFCDENHSVASLGGAGHESSFSRRQHRVAVDPDTGELKRVADGGVVPKRKFRVVPKYSTEARGCYGACCPVIDGVEKAQFIETFDYTEKKLISLKAYKILMQKEMAYRRKMKSQGWRNYNGANPYLERYGNDWEAHLKESPALRKYK